MDMKALTKLSNYFYVIKYAVTALKLYLVMLNCKLPTNFQLNVFIFEAKAGLLTLLQSLKQIGRKCF